MPRLVVEIVPDADPSKPPQVNVINEDFEGLVDMIWALAEANAAVAKRLKSERDTIKAQVQRRQIEVAGPAFANGGRAN